MSPAEVLERAFPITHCIYPEGQGAKQHVDYGPIPARPSFVPNSVENITVPDDVIENALYDRDVSGCSIPPLELLAANPDPTSRSVCESSVRTLIAAGTFFASSLVFTVLTNRDNRG